MTTLEITPDIGRLEQSIAQLWQRAREQHPDEMLTRALTLNLVAVTDRGHEQEVRDAVATLLLRHPCRVFLVLLDDAEANITAQLCAEVHELRNCRQMVLEQLTLTANTSDFAKLPGLVRPLLVNDIPVHLFWAMPLPKDLGHLAAMSAMADRTILDSTLFAEGDWHRLQLVDFLEPLDLAWLRLRPWRRALAEALEHFEWDPATPTRVTITHGGKHGARATAHKLSGWLKDRLEAEVTLCTDPDAQLTCEPTSLALQHGSAHVQITHLPDEPRLEVRVTLEDSCLLPFHVLASRGHRGDLLAAAVDS